VFAAPKKASGIYGQALFQNNTPLEDGFGSYFLRNCAIIVKDARTGKVVKRGYSNKLGKFKITLPPGRYIVFPIEKYYTANAITDKTEVNVWQGFYAQVNATFNNGW
jgi:hypothetical protein